MLPSVVLIFGFLAVTTDALRTTGGEKVFVNGWVKCKEQDPERRIVQTFEIDVGQEQGNTFTTQK